MNEFDSIKNEYEQFTEKLKAILPFEAKPSRELVVAMRNKIPMTLKSILIITSVYNSGDINGIICTTEIEKEVFACGLTHLVIPADNSLHVEIRKHQERRIKRLKTGPKQYMDNKIQLELIAH